MEGGEGVNIPSAEGTCGICKEEGVRTYKLHGCDRQNAQRCNFCGPCLTKYFRISFLEKKKSFLDINCPTPKCDGVYKEEHIKAFADDESMAHYKFVYKSIPDHPEDPNLNIEDFDYTFNDKGELVRKSDPSKGFHWVNQKHYDLLGDLIIPYIQDRMVKDFGYEKVLLPLKVPADLPDHIRSDIYLSPDFRTNKKKLMLLIQGSGAVRAGQWARAVCINDSIEKGSILPYLRMAKDDGYSVVVFNPNLNRVPEAPNLRPKREEFFKGGWPRVFVDRKTRERELPATIGVTGNETPSRHVVYVYDHFVRDNPAKYIVAVAHSAGGGGLMNLLRDREEEILPRLKGIAFTDSVHSVYPGDSRAIQSFVRQNAINWVQSDLPLDAPEREGWGSGCTCVSAGHPKHEYTSPCSITSVFKFLNSKIPQ